MTIKEISKELETILADYESGKIGAQELYDNIVDANMALSYHIEQAEKTMRIEIIINDETIMGNIQYEIDNMLEDEEISFEDEQERQEFADDCLDEIVSKTECRPEYYPTWEAILETVHSMASMR